MKKRFLLMMFAVLLASTAGCRIGECWREAWNSRFHPQQPQQAVIVTDPCVVSESVCNPCPSPCGATPMITPGPTSAR
jgi:hypothetical protein